MTANIFKSLNRSVDLVNSVTKKIAVSQLIKKRDRVLLSLSGGQDSICLLFVLNQMSDQMELHLAFIWCHHLWQIDSFFLMKQIAKLSFLFQFDSCFAIPSHFIFSELLARNWRYNCSYRVSLFYNYSKIGIAHSANDKVETLFLNLMRGTGLSGLSPLRWTQLLLKKPLVNEKTQDHVSQLPTFLVSPFFWSSTSFFLRNFSPSVFSSFFCFPNREDTIKKQYVQQAIKHCDHSQWYKKYSKPFCITLFGNTVIPQHYSHYHFQRYREYNITTIPSFTSRATILLRTDGMQQRCCYHTLPSVCRYAYVGGTHIYHQCFTIPKVGDARWYVKMVMQSYVIDMLQIIMLKQDQKSKNRTNKKVWKNFWHIWVEYATKPLKRLTNRKENQVASFFYCKPKNNETIQNLSCVTRKPLFYTPKKDTIFDVPHKDLYISSRFFIFQKKFSLRVKRIVLKKFPLHTNEILKKKGGETKSKKWFYCVSYTFLKTCLCSTN